MNVLSLFDGMSCGRIALERASVHVDNYFACEIDKYAMQVSAANWPDIKQMGDIRGIEIVYYSGTNETRIFNWLTGQDYTFKGKIDLIIGGTPCQGFSFAGKQLNFEDPRSKLFFEFVYLWKEIKKHNPEVLFFLENVQMKKEHQQVISDCLGVKPIMVNSALVSAQNRKRLYWTNLPFFNQPVDRYIFLKDILETHENRLYANIQTALESGLHYVKNKNKYEPKGEKSLCLDANYYKGEDNHGQRSLIKEIGNIYPGKGQNGRVYSADGKSPSLRANTGGMSEPKISIKQLNPSKESNGQQPYMINRIYDAEGKSVSLTQLSGSINVKTVYPASIVGRRLNENGKREDYNSEVPITQCLQVKHDSTKTGTLTTVDKDNILTTLPPGRYENVYENKLLNGITYRKLTPIECERLQTVPDNYTAHVSNTQRYKMLGNGWNVETIVHFFKWIPILDEL
jgi:DNA-cytosine methyltransferase